MCHSDGHGRDWRMKAILPLLMLVMAIGASSPGFRDVPAKNSEAEPQERTSQHKNLQVLPKDISKDELGDIMLDILRGLGLPRRSGQGCLHCHVGSLDVPRSQWNYASDEKPAKQQARAMLRMTREINEKHLPSLAPRPGAVSSVSCHTCHTGRLNPQPLEELLLTQFDSGGVAAVEETYSRLRNRHFAANAYDFRLGTLRDVADQLSARGEPDAAVAIHTLNAKANEQPSALGGVVRVRMRQALKEGGADQMVAAYGDLKKSMPMEALQPPLLNALGWSIYREGRKDAAFRLFELNCGEHPGSYIATEGLAWGCKGMGDKERAIKIAKAWVKKHPNHELGQRLLIEISR